jgi:hypothetical protein
MATKAPAAIVPTVKEIVAAADDFENPNVGESFGGNYPRIELAENTVSPLLTYSKDSKVQVENDNGMEVISAPVALNSEDGKLYSLPISAIFRKHWKEADVQPGDTFRFKRYVDAVKKRGKGAGNKLKVFAIKVYTRVPRTTAAAAQ